MDSEKIPERVPPPPIDIPSILEQTQWPVGFYSFQGQTNNTFFFNSGLVEWRGNTFLITRRRDGVNSLNSGRDSISFWLLRENVPVREFKVRFKMAFPGENHEDPRAIVINDKVLLSYCNYRKGSWAHQAIALLDNSLFAGAPIHPVFGFNGSNMLRSTGHEKNWVWFLHNDKMHLVYKMSPFHMVLEMEHGPKRGESMSQIYSRRFKCPWWKWGEPRGGTPPVRVGDEYFAFFHSSMPWWNHKRRYYMGAYSFRAEPPFEITKCSVKPILTGSHADLWPYGYPAVCFPCGSLLQGDKWLVSLGVNDCMSAWIKIPHTELLNTMRYALKK